MISLGVMLLVASATTGAGKPHVGGMMFHRHGAVADGPPPPGGPIQPGPGGMGGMGGHAANRRFPNVKSQIVFFGPGGPNGAGDVKIGWQSGAGNGERVYLPGRGTPFRYNFLQGYIYRLRLSDISGRPGLNLYPTIEVAPSTPATDAYLTHNQIPVQFTAEDFDQVEGGNFVTKVIYLPDPRFQELAVANVETLVSTRLEPGVDPVIEADKRGTILLIVRLGGIDLEMEGTGAITIPGDTAPAPVPGPSTTTTLPPGAFPTNVVPTPPINTVPVDEAPATPIVPGVMPPTPAPATPPTPTEPVPADPAPADPAPAPTPAPPSADLPGL